MRLNRLNSLIGSLSELHWDNEQQSQLPEVSISLNLLNSLIGSLSELNWDNERQSQLPEVSIA